MSDYLGSEPAGIAMQNASHSGKTDPVVQPSFVSSTFTESSEPLVPA